MTNPHVVADHPLLEVTDAEPMAPQQMTSPLVFAEPGIELPDVAPYEGPGSQNPFAHTHFNYGEQITFLDRGGNVVTKSLGDLMNVSVAYWHTVRDGGLDPFSQESPFVQNWDTGDGSIDNAKRVADALINGYVKRLGVKRYAFHTRDIAPFPKSRDINDFQKNVEEVVTELKRLQGSDIEPLWGTAALFTDPVYMVGAGSTSHWPAFLQALKEVEISMRATYELGGKGYVFWGGREGYWDLVNTNMPREMDNLGKFLGLAVELNNNLATAFGASPLKLYIEPKPKEPTAHQYDFDAASCLNFLRKYDLLGELTLNIETNHATLAGHTMLHELITAIADDSLGSIDGNFGDLLLGWDTDHNVSDFETALQIAEGIVANGGLGVGGINLDAKRQRVNTTPRDCFHAQLLAINYMAVGIKAAAILQLQGIQSGAINNLWSTWNGSDLARKVEAGTASVDELLRAAEAQGANVGMPKSRSTSMFRALRMDAVECVLKTKNFADALAEAGRRAKAAPSIVV